MTTFVARTVEFRGFGVAACMCGLVLAVVPGASAAMPVARAAPLAAQAEGASKYGGLMPLVRAHREDQVKMVKLWQSMKAGDVSEKTREAYKVAQIATQKSSNKVTQFINQERWSEEDRAAMNKLWTDELEKPVQ
ncbi:MAG: hypothetical protein RI990_780 [Planctomycetota bacterium]|jgi:hypothetical protein